MTAVADPLLCPHCKLPKITLGGEDVCTGQCEGALEEREREEGSAPDALASDDVLYPLEDLEDDG